MTATSAATVPLASREPDRRLPLRPGEWATIAYAGALLVVILPAVSGTHWTPKAALVLVALVPGAVALGRQLATRDSAAFAGAAFVVVAGAATLLSPSPMLALIGLYNVGTGFLFVLALVGAWALGRQLSVRGARLLGSVVLAAAVANAVMCWLEMSSFFSGDLFARVDGRAPGLLGNPVHVSALLVGAFALAIERAREPADVTRTNRIAYIAACALFASGVQLSGGRTGLLLLALVVIYSLVRSGWRTTVVVIAVGAAGVLLASGSFPSDSGAAARLAGSGSSLFAGRIDRWRLALPAVGDRPVLGIGPGLYRRATSPHDTVAAARAFGADALYEEAHNLIAQYAVTTGILGLAMLTLWIALAAVGARGELAWFTLFAALSLFVEPQFVGLTPVLALTFGAASPRAMGPAPPWTRAVVAVGLVVGLVAAGLLVRGDDELGQAIRDRCPATAIRAADRLPMWPEAPLLAAQRETAHRGCSSVGRADAAVRDAHLAVERDPSAPPSWSALGEYELDRGRTQAAARAYAQALRWNPQSTTALAALAGIAHERGDRAEVARFCARFRAVLASGHCPPATR
jgi:O-antigen ligase